eukprot:326022-Pelagomonas_calceolata.AAC.2
MSMSEFQRLQTNQDFSVCALNFSTLHNVAHPQASGHEASRNQSNRKKNSNKEGPAQFIQWLVMLVERKSGCLMWRKIFFFVRGGGKDEAAAMRRIETYLICTCEPRFSNLIEILTSKGNCKASVRLFSPLLRYGVMGQHGAMLIHSLLVLHYFNSIRTISPPPIISHARTI